MMSFKSSPSHAVSAASVRLLTFSSLIYVSERTLKPTGLGHSVTIQSLSSSQPMISGSVIVSKLDGQYFPFS